MNNGEQDVEQDGERRGRRAPQESEHDEELDFTEAPVSGAFPWGGGSRPSIA